MKKSRFLKYFFMLGLVITLGGAWGTHTASAATIMVTSLSDNETSDNNCTLREAIKAASTNADYNGCKGVGAFSDNAAGNFDTITFFPAFPPNLPLMTDWELTIKNTNVIIDGSIAGGKIIIDGNKDISAHPKHRVFNITGGNVVLKNLTIQNGRFIVLQNDPNPGSEVGTGIKMKGSNLIIENCNISGNRNVNNGGGIYQNGGTMVIKNSKINNNILENGAFGGGIYVKAGTLNVYKTFISNNTANSNNKGQGGGIYIEGGTVYLSHTLVSGNNGNGGGGIANKGNLSITSSNIHANTSPNSSALYNENGTVKIDNTTIDQNVGDFGTIMNLSGSPKIVIKNSTIVNNKTSQPNTPAFYENTDLTSSIVANNKDGSNQINDCPVGGITSHGYNLISENFCAGLGGDSSNKVNTDPQLGLPLLTTDGTFYYVPGNLSAALDAGPATPISPADQLGTARPQGIFSDIGAYEKPTVGVVEFGIDSVTVKENVKEIILPIKRTNGDLDTKVKYSVSFGTANSNDVTVFPNSYQPIAVNEKGADIKVTIIDDSKIENDETFSVNLEYFSGGPLLSSKKVVHVTIKDNDAIVINPGIILPGNPGGGIVVNPGILNNDPNIVITPQLLGDYIKPKLTLNQAVEDPTSNTTPTFVFSSDEKGTVSYNGPCKGNVSSGEANQQTTVTLTTEAGAAFTAGQSYLDCNVSVTDLSNNKNQSDWLAVGDFTVISQPAIVDPDPVQNPAPNGNNNPNPDPAANPNQNPNQNPSPAQNPGQNPNPNPANNVPADVLCAGFSDLFLKDNGSQKANITQVQCDDVTYVKSIGAMTGSPVQGSATLKTFNPKDNLQRDQITKIIIVTYKKDANMNCVKMPFPDVTKAAWSYEFVCRGTTLIINGSPMITGYLSGVDKGFFRPARFVTIPEFFALLLRPLSEKMPSNDSVSFANVQKGLWYSGFAKYVKDHNLDTSFNVTANVPRLKVAEIIHKLHNLGKL